MKILLLIPILFYLLLVLVNWNLLHTEQVINLFWAKEISIPFLFYNSIFIVLYSVIVFFAYDWLNIFLKYKIKKQEKEIVFLKSQLFDNQEKLLKNISKEIENWKKEIKKENKELIKNLEDKHFEKIQKLIKDSDEKLEKYKNTNKELLLQHWKETDKLLSKINLIDKWILDKIKNSLK